MCRLLAYASRTPVTLTDLVGTTELAEFVELSKTHCDGWGLAYAEEQGVGRIRVPDPAHSSPEFVAVSQEHRSDLAIAHVRWATDDLAIDVRNTHPFTDGRMAFAHNGAIRPASALDALVAPELRADREGTTDSERYFLAVADRARRMEPADALAQTTAAIADGGVDYTCLNATLLTDTELIQLLFVVGLVVALWHGLPRTMRAVLRRRREDRERVPLAEPESAAGNVVQGAPASVLGLEPLPA